MTKFLTLYKRELSSLYYTPTGYIVMSIFIGFLGWIFWIIVQALNRNYNLLEANVFGLLFGSTFFYWMIISAITASLTMRSFAEERRSGTIEVLLTAPVTDTQVVLSKFFAALTFLTILWVPTTIYVFILARYATVDYGIVYTGYLGTFLLNAMLTALGIMISSFTRSQFVSFFTTFVVIMVLFSMNFMLDKVTPFWRMIIQFASVVGNFAPFTSGVIDSRSIVYFVSITVFLLFCTIKSVESYKWR